MADGSGRVVAADAYTLRGILHVNASRQEGVYEYTCMATRSRVTSTSLSPAFLDCRSSIRMR